MTEEIISSSSPRKYGTGPGSNSQPLDLQSDSHLLPDTLPTALCGPVNVCIIYMYSKTCLKRPLKKRVQKIGFQYRLSLKSGQKYCRMLQEHSAILSTFIQLQFVFKTFILSIFEWPLKTGFTVLHKFNEIFIKI